MLLMKVLGKKWGLLPAYAVKKGRRIFVLVHSAFYHLKLILSGKEKTKAHGLAECVVVTSQLGETRDVLPDICPCISLCIH